MVLWSVTLLPSAVALPQLVAAELCWALQACTHCTAAVLGHAGVRQQRLPRVLLRAWWPTLPPLPLQNQSRSIASSSDGGRTPDASIFDIGALAVPSDQVLPRP